MFRGIQYPTCTCGHYRKYHNDSNECTKCKCNHYVVKAKKKKNPQNNHKKKGTDFERDWVHYTQYHGFDAVRSYASLGVCDARSIPPKEANSTLIIGAQCKNRATEDYVEPKERDNLQRFAEAYHCLVVLPFKHHTEHTCYVKLEPWKLDGRIITPEQFLKEFYGLKADSWTEFNSNWTKGIRRRPNYLKEIKDSKPLPSGTHKT